DRNVTGVQTCALPICREVPTVATYFTNISTTSRRSKFSHLIANGVEPVNACESYLARMLFMIAIMTVTGADRTGIIAQVTTALAELNVNIVDVSQTLMSGYFTTIQRMQLLDSETPIQKIQERMKPVEEQTQQVILIQSQDLFTAMTEIYMEPHSQWHLKHTAS